jgi:uncharacterized protein YkwD
MNARSGSALLLAVTALALAACGGGGGGGEKTPPVSPKTGPGGTVNVEPTAGQLGPAETVSPGKTNVIGKPGKIAPNANRPTNAQQHGVAGTAACASASANPASNNLGSVSAAILCLLNGERAAKGLPRLHSNPRLVRASKLMAKLMVSKRFFAHDTPDGRSLLDRVKPTGYVKGRWQLGENLAWGSGPLATPRSIVNGWMHSPGHKANILHGSFKDIGIGIRLGPPQSGLTGGATYVTDFGRHG